MNDKTIRGLEDPLLDALVRSFSKDIPFLQHMLSVALREQRRRARVARHLAERRVRGTEEAGR